MKIKYIRRRIKIYFSVITGQVIHFTKYNGKTNLSNLIHNIKIMKIKINNLEDLNYHIKVHIKNNITLKRFEKSTYI